MHFTREPIIETIISAREGHKLVLRNSKGGGLEEFMIDSVEVISFGGTYFFRSQEKPKPFLIPVSDYEILETREARMVLKGVGIEKGIKIAGGKEAVIKTPKGEEEEGGRPEKRRERRRPRKKKGDSKKEAPSVEQETPPAQKEKSISEQEGSMERERPSSALIPPPTTLISETLSRYKETPVYAGAFFEERSKEGASPEKKSVVVDEQEDREEPSVHQEVDQDQPEPAEPAPSPETAQQESANQNATDTDEELPF